MQVLSEEKRKRGVAKRIKEKKSWVVEYCSPFLLFSFLLFAYSSLFPLFCFALLA